MKKFFRNYLISLILLFVAIVFCACSSTRVMTIFSEDGSVEELVYIGLDFKQIEAMGENNSNVKEYAQLLATITATKLATDYNLQNSSNFPNIEQPIKVIDVVWYSDDSFMVGLKFASTAVYKDYYSIASSNNAVMQTEKHFLYTKYYQTGSTIYVAESKLYNEIKNAVLISYPNFIEADNELLYTYQTSSRREHSDANYITHTNGKYYHTWVIDNNNLAQPITIYYILANRANIILLCLGISLAVCAILGTIVLIKNKKENKKEQN